MKNNGAAIARLVLVVMVPAVMAAIECKPLGEIDFFGYKGIDLAAIRSALPFHEGDLFPPAKAKSFRRPEAAGARNVKQVIGRPPTDIAFICCDSKQHDMVYIGLPGESYQALAFNPAPAGHIRFPKAALALREEFDKAWMNAVMKGHATEDDSEGYTLTNEPKAKTRRVGNSRLRPSQRGLDFPGTGVVLGCVASRHCRPDARLRASIRRAGRCPGPRKFGRRRWCSE